MAFTVEVTCHVNALYRVYLSSCKRLLD